MEKVSIVKLFSQLNERGIEIWLSDEGWMMYEILLSKDPSLPADEEEKSGVMTA